MDHSNYDVDIDDVHDDSIHDDNTEIGVDHNHFIWTTVYKSKLLIIHVYIIKLSC